MTKQQKRAIEREFYNYKSNKKQAAEYVASHAFDGFGLDYDAVRVKGGQPNGQERRIVSEVSEAERLLCWCLVFENTLTKFRWEKKDELMHKKYIERKGVFRICLEIGIGRPTYFRWLEEIRQTALQWALELQLF